MSDIEIDAEANATAEPAAVAGESPTKRTAERVLGPSRYVNPVLWREARTRFESGRTGWLVFAYVLLLGAIVTLAYLGSTSDYGGTPIVTRFGSIGRTVFETTVLVTAFLLMVFVPPQAASSITNERERQTLMPMQITLMRPLQIVLGKLGSSLIFTALLILLTAPILALGYMIGGVTIRDVIVGVAMLLLIAALTTSIGVWWSSMVRRSSAAIVLTLVTLFALVGGTAIIYQTFVVIHENRGQYPGEGPAFVLSANPIAALADAVGEDTQFDSQFAGFNEFGPMSDTSDTGPLSSLKQSIFFHTIGPTSDEFIFGEAGIVPTTVPVFPLPSDTTTSDSSVTDSTTSESTTADSSGTDSASSDFSADSFVVEMSASVMDSDVMVDPNSGMIMDPERVRAVRNQFPLFAKFIIVALVLIALTTWSAANRLRTPAKKER